MNFLGIPLLGTDGALSFPKDHLDCGFSKAVMDGFSLKQSGDQKWYLIKLILASLIAATSLIGNSKEGVIGSMLVSPLSVPVIGLIGAMFLGNENDAIRSFGFILLSIGIMFGSGYVVGKMNPNFVPGDEMTNRYQAPSMNTFINAVIIGSVFAIGALTAHKNIGMGVSELIGAGIAISLLPPIVNAGMAYSNNSLDDKITKVKNSLMTGVYNMGGIATASIIIFFTNCVWDWIVLEESSASGISKLGIE